MRRHSDMLFLLISLLYWTQTEGGCDGAIVSIYGNHSTLPAGGGFKLSCQFSCLRPEHVAQLWRVGAREDRVSLVNVTSSLPSVTLVLGVSSATKADTGYYSCMTQPPDTISTPVLIQIEDDLTTPTLTTPGTPRCDSTLQHSSAAGLQGQLWCWILLGKTALLLLLLFSLASMAVKCKGG